MLSNGPGYSASCGAACPLGGDSDQPAQNHGFVLISQTTKLSLNASASNVFSWRACGPVGGAVRRLIYQGFC